MLKINQVLRPRSLNSSSQQSFSSQPWRFSLLTTISLTIACFIFILASWQPNSKAARNSSKQESGRQPPPPATRPVAYRSPGKRHKVRITDPALARQLLARGGQLLAQYDQAQLISVAAADLLTLSIA